MSAVEELLGLELQQGWRVTKRLGRPSGSTGGAFSQSYIVERNGTVAFLKALDFSEAFAPGVDTLTKLQEFISGYENERDVLLHCRDKKLSNVTLAIDQGFIDVPKYSRIEGRVYFLIFEMANGDVRGQMNAASALDPTWCMQALRSAALGLWQVHRELIAHQDVKPSNILTYSGGDFKVTDFGRASRRGQPIFHNNFQFPGDRTYAPPELLYGYTHPDFVPRRVGTDIYMLGNLAAFLFRGTNITSEILANVAQQHHWQVWQGTYSAVLPYLQEAFGRVLADVEGGVPEVVRPVVVSLVSELCQPDLGRRGHPRGIGKSNQYSLERYVSSLSNFTRGLEIRTGARRTFS